MAVFGQRRMPSFNYASLANEGEAELEQMMRRGRAFHEDGVRRGAQMTQAPQGNPGQAAGYMIGSALGGMLQGGKRSDAPTEGGSIYSGTPQPNRDPHASGLMPNAEAQLPRSRSPQGLFGSRGPNQPRALDTVDPSQSHGGPDYAGHYMMHGRNPDGSYNQPPEKKRNTGQKILKFLGDGLLNYAASQGNVSAQLKIKDRFDQKRLRAEQEAAFADHDRIVQAMMRKGMSADEAELVALNPEKFADHYATRYRSEEINEGNARHTPNLDGTANIFTAPKTHKEGADVIQTPPHQGVIPAPMFGAPTPAPNRLSGLRTEAEQYADTIAPRGSPQWESAIQDYTLKGDGPTAYGYKDRLQDDRLAVARENNIRSTGVSRDNNIRSTNTSRDNNVRSNNRPRTGRGRGGAGNEPFALGPNGERLVVRGGQWVDERTGKPVR